MKIHFTLQNQLSELSTLNGKLEELESRWNLSKKFLTETNLVLDELITNIIEHGDKKKKCIISVTLVKEPENITIEVTDKGPPFDPTRCAMPDTNLSLDKRKCGGLGVLFIRKFSDDCSYERHQNTNIFKLIKNLPQEGR